MKYEILSVELNIDFKAKNIETGEIIILDLFCDGSFPERDNIPDNEYVEFAYSLIGNIIEVDEIRPYIPCYFACGVRTIKR